MRHYSFPHIGSFAQAMKSLQRRERYTGKGEDGYPRYDELKKLDTAVPFVGTVKLHGTNTAIVIDPRTREMYAQSRNRVITVGDDNYGFAGFVAGLNPDDLLKDIETPTDYEKIVIYGEWVGKGIQSKVAVSELEKSWFVFATKGTIVEDGEEEPSWWGVGRVSSPEANVYYMHDFASYLVEVDLNNPSKVEDKLNKITEMVAEECPVGKELGVKGHGEGVVWRPAWHTKRYDFAFKVKGDKHSSGGEKKARVVEPASTEVIDFVRETVTEERFEQGLAMLAETGEVDVKRTGEFLGWIVKDILREEDAKLGELNLQKVKKELGKAARTMFINHVNKI